MQLGGDYETNRHFAFEPTVNVELAVDGGSRDDATAVIEKRSLGGRCSLFWKIVSPPGV